MNKIILIMAAGENKRWGDDCKQLVDIAGEPLIMRTIRQLRAMLFNPIVVTHNNEIKAVLDEEKVDMIEPLFRYWLVESILSTVHYWKGRMIILLGDVVWSDEALEKVLFDNRPVAVYGTHAELYALCWDATTIAMIPTFRKVRKHAIQSRSRAGSCGKLWNVYRALEGKSLDKHQLYYENNVFVPIEDWTIDIDLKPRYEKFIESVVEKGLLGANASP